MGQSSGGAASSTAPASFASEQKPALPPRPSPGGFRAGPGAKRLPELMGRKQSEDVVSEVALLSARTRARPSCCARPVDKVSCGEALWCESETIPATSEDEHDQTVRQLDNGDLMMLRHVTGMLTPTGGIYTGQIGLDGRPNGDGAQKYPDGTFYKGQWYEGGAHGEGELRLPNGKGFSGSWKAGLKNGYGRENYDHGISYTGEFAEGYREGHGKLILANGSSYDGNFVKGEFHGEGELTWPDNRVYTGQWRAGLMHGFGQYDWPDGKSHSGHYEEDQRHGPGVFKWPDGSVCKGRWEDGKLHGSGTYVDSEGVSRHGRWEHGERLYWTK